MGRKKISFEDGTLARTQLVLSDALAPDLDLAAEYAQLAEGYRSLLRKLNKTLVITDGYQSQLQGLNSSLSQQVEEETERRVSHERMLLQLAGIHEFVWLHQPVDQTPKQAPGPTSTEPKPGVAGS